MIAIRRRPYLLNWAGNPVDYELFDNDAIGNPDITFEVRVTFALLEDFPPMQEIAIVPLVPFEGTAKIDLSAILNAHLKFFVPSLNSNAQRTGLQSGRFYVEFRSVTPDDTVVAWISTELTRYIFKGGISVFQWKNNNFFESYFPAQKPFFTWQKRSRLVSLNERVYLSWLNTAYNDIEGGNLRVKVQVTCTDGTTALTDYPIGGPLSLYHFYFVQAGADKLALGDLVAGKTIQYWDTWIVDATGGSDTQLSEKFRLVNDQRNDYNQVTLHYRNSLGGLDSVRIRGVVETNVSLDGPDLESAAAADWIFSDELARLDGAGQHRETLSYKGDIGYLEKTDQDRLRDAFLNREVWMERSGRWWPVKLLTKQYRLRTTSDMRWNLPIEWAIADTGSYYYTPEDISLGEGVETSNVCASIVGLNISGITWDSGNATVTVHWAISGVAVGLQYRIAGYVDEWTSVDPFTAIGNFVYTVGEGTFITIEFRVVCAPGVYGATNSVTADTTEVPPAANSMVRNDSGSPFSFVFTRNSVTIASGTLNPGDSYPFFCPTGAANFQAVVTGISPSEGSLMLSDGGIAGTVSGNTITWPLTGVDAAGVGVIIS